MTCSIDAIMIRNQSETSVKAALRRCVLGDTALALPRPSKCDDKCPVLQSNIVTPDTALNIIANKMFHSSRLNIKTLLGVLLGQV